MGQFQDSVRISQRTNFTTTFDGYVGGTPEQLNPVPDSVTLLTGVIKALTTFTTPFVPVTLGSDIDQRLKLADNVVATANIMDAAIKTAKIGDAQIVNASIASLAVDDAKIANCSINKLVAGTLLADLVIGARIKTANVGPRVELNFTGIEVYSNTQRTFFADAFTGNVTITGTITATTGIIGGFTVGATNLVAGSGATSVILDTVNGIALGGTAGSGGNAPFRVLQNGNLFATNATITGGTIRTAAAPNARWEMSSVNAETLLAYTGDTGEVLYGGVIFGIGGTPNTATANGYMGMVPPQTRTLTGSQTDGRINSYSRSVNGTTQIGGTDVYGDYIRVTSAWTTANLTTLEGIFEIDMPLARCAKDLSVSVIADLNVSGTGDVTNNGKSIPRGYLGESVGPASQTDCTTTFTNVCTLTFNVISGRRYRITGHCNGSQITAAGTSRYQIADDQSGSSFITYQASLAVGQFLVANGVHWFTATSTRSCTVTVQGAAAAGAIRTAANGSALVAEDMGI